MKIRRRGTLWSRNPRNYRKDIALRRSSDNVVDSTLDPSENTNIVPEEMSVIPKSDRKRIVYSVCTDNYDTVQPVKFPDPNIRYILFTNTDAPDGWETIYWGGGRRESREPKMLPHIYLPPHDESLYVDGSIRFLQSPTLLFEMLDSGFAACPHPTCHNLDSHVKMMLAADFGDNKLIHEQIQRYREDGFRDVSPMTENTVLLRMNIDIVNEVNGMWWTEYCNGSSRDQLSLPYVFYKKSFIPQFFPFNNRKNKYYEGWWDHNWKKLESEYEKIRIYKPDRFRKI